MTDLNFMGSNHICVMAEATVIKHLMCM